MGQQMQMTLGISTEFSTSVQQERKFTSLHPHDNG